jgi:predicted AAA+ superfamily ATPase
MVLTDYHGAFVENLVAQQLTAMADGALHYWRNVGREAEVDFLFEREGSVLPLEAKAGVNVRSKSLAFYASKYAPPLAIRTSLRNLRLDRRVLNVPLYALQSLATLLTLALPG